MKYFNLKELSKSETATALGINNEPSDEIKTKLVCLITRCLDPLRESCGFPITISSGYRCDALNKAVGGELTSQHLRGEAADLIGRTKEETRHIFEVAKKLNNHDQLLFERNKKGNLWVHISWKCCKNRLQTIDNYKG